MMKVLRTVAGLLPGALVFAYLWSGQATTWGAALAVLALIGFVWLSFLWQVRNRRRRARG